MLPKPQPHQRSPRPGKRPVSLLFGLLLAALPLVSCWPAPQSAPTATELGEVSEVQFPAIGGEPVRLADFTGQLVVVDFWATWCSPCRLQAEILHELHAELEGQGVQFLAISLGEPEDIVREFADRNPSPYPVLMDPEEVLGQALEIYALPTVMILGKEGDVSYLRPGVSSGDALRRALRESGADVT